MEAVSEFYLAYLRPNLWLVFIAGLAVIVLHPSEQKEPKKSAYDTVFLKPTPKTLAEFFGYWRASTLLNAPIFIWLVVFGIIATILDVALGTK